MKNKLSIISLALLGVVACTKVTETGKKQVLVTERLGVDYNDDYPHHMQNSFGEINNQMADLGRVLFYDESLSINERVSCASCHIQGKGFSDNKAGSTGFAMATTPRNSMALGNTSLSSTLFWDGRENNLVDQVVVPITNHIEMGYGNLNQMIDRIKTKDYYPALFANVFITQPGAEMITKNRIAIALGTFIGSIRSFRNELDNAMAEVPFTSSPWSGGESADDIVLADTQAQRGFELFGDLGCASCHSSSNIGGNSFGNIGLDMEYSDQGVASWSNEEEAIGHFKIPSLRNVALSAPYMHDGRFSTLEQVVEHYNSGIQPHANLSWQFRNNSEFETLQDALSAGIQLHEIFIDEENEFIENQPVRPIRMGLTEQQKSDLVAFLHALTDTEMIRDTRYSNPFDYVAE